MRRTWLQRSVRAVVAIAVAATSYVGVYRPLQLRWGATSAEVAADLPGDRIQPHPIFDATRAVTIDRPADQVWPWLVQIGYHRAGWYSGLDWADNGGVPSAKRIVPELQRIEVGDHIPVTGRGDPFSFVPEITWTVVDFRRDSYILATSAGGRDSWLWLLRPMPGGRTRLIWRMRNAPYQWVSPFIVLQLATDLGDFIFVRNILLSIKERVESRPDGALAASAPMVLSWIAAFSGFLCALVVFVLRHDWAEPLLAVASACAVTIALVFAMPPLSVDIVVATGVWAGLWALWRRAPAQRTRPLPAEPATVTGGSSS
jgi:hypothetical protein